MPSTLIASLYGLIGGIIGAIVLAILMTLTEGMMETNPPKVIAEARFGDPDAAPKVLFPYFSIWGIIFGLTVAFGWTVGGMLATGAVFSLAPWLVLNFAMLPSAGAGFLGLDRSNMMWLSSLVMIVIWGLVTGWSYSLFTGLFG